MHPVRRLDYVNHVPGVDEAGSRRAGDLGPEGHVLGGHLQDADQRRDDIPHRPLSPPGLPVQRAVLRHRAERARALLGAPAAGAAPGQGPTQAVSLCGRRVRSYSKLLLLPVWKKKNVSSDASRYCYASDYKQEN